MLWDQSGSSYRSLFKDPNKCATLILTRTLMRLAGHSCLLTSKKEKPRSKFWEDKFRVVPKHHQISNMMIHSGEACHCISINLQPSHNNDHWLIAGLVVSVRISFGSDWKRASDWERVSNNKWILVKRTADKRDQLVIHLSHHPEFALLSLLTKE